MNNGIISKDERHGMTADDWGRLDAKSDNAITDAAIADPDAQPLTDDQLSLARRPALAKRVRQKLRMGQETFAISYGIPLEALRAWERHEIVPTQTEMAYLQLIEREPERARLITV
jgi:putative transcriptional regulator